MIDLLLSPFTCDTCGFMQRALLGGLLTVITTSLVGAWVVIRGMSFMGDALAHGVTPGIALAIVLGFDRSLGAIAAAIVMIVAINVVHRAARLHEETSIGLLFVGMLALGVVILSTGQASYFGSLTGLLFGDPLGLTGSDIVQLAWTTALTAVVVVAFYRPFLVLSFNEEKAKVLGLFPGVAHLVLLGLLTLSVVASFRAVGVLLVFGLLVAPPATASLLARRVPSMIAAAMVFGALSVYVGLLVSWHLGAAGGASIALTAVVLFFVVLGLRGVARRRDLPRTVA